MNFKSSIITLFLFKIIFFEKKKFNLRLKKKRN
jgi:hypothetical protein